MTRAEYIKVQKNRFDRRVMAVFPARAPKELLWAGNILPVEVWDPPGRPIGAAAHLQPYVCSVVRQGLELLLRGGAEQVDGLLFPHTCDSIQNLASLVNDYLDLDRPCYFLYHPKAPYGPAAREYYINQLKYLSDQLADRFGPLDRAELGRMVALGRRISRRIANLYRRRLDGTSGLTNREFYDLIRRGEWLWPDDFLAELEAALARPTQDRPARRRSIILSGVLTNPVELLTSLDQLGVDIAADDLINAGRRLLVRSPAPAEDDRSPADPWAALADNYFALPPCSTVNASIADRAAWLVDRADQAGARGAVFQVTKFCETELFDLPNLIAALDRAGLPGLVVETEINQPPSGQLLTRLEAFLEMIG